MIKITSRGYVITDRGRVPTPIMTPYRESIDTIFKMLSQQPSPTIIEVLPNGRLIPLNTSNFDKDNELIKPDISPVNVVPSVNNAEKQDNPAPVNQEKQTPETYNQADTNNAEKQDNPAPVNQEKQNYQQKKHNKNKSNKQNKGNDKVQQPIVEPDEIPVTE